MTVPQVKVSKKPFCEGKAVCKKKLWLLRLFFVCIFCYFFVYSQLQYRTVNSMFFIINSSLFNASQPLMQTSRLICLSISFLISSLMQLISIDVKFSLGGSFLIVQYLRALVDFFSPAISPKYLQNQIKFFFSSNN